jgi:SAM-dependent methyltransferase
MAIAEKLLKEFAPLDDKHVYALTSGGPLFEFLRRRAGRLTYSVFDLEVQPGEFKKGVQCQDVQKLTYEDDSFDVCVHSEVFEHVPDDLTGFREIFRVLKKGGMTIFTVPLFNAEQTVERAILVDGKVKHLLPPVYHNDQMRGQVLAFRDYGRDLINRLENAGFVDVAIAREENLAISGPKFTTPGFSRPVIVGRK